MAKKLNKNIVVGLTIAGMAVTTAAGIMMVLSLPKKDHAPLANQAKEALERGEHTQAWKLYGRAAHRAKTAGERDIANEYLLSAGDAALAGGDARRAQQLWGEALLNNPQYTPAQERIVKLFVELAEARGMPWSQVQPEAEKLVSIAEKNNTKSYLGLHALGRSLIELRAVRESYAAEGKKHLIEAFNGDKSNAQYAKSLASLYVSEGDIKNALAVYDALMANPSQDAAETVKAYRFRAQLYMESSVQAKIPEADKLALADLEKSVSLGAKDVEALVALGDYWHIRKVRGWRERAPEAEIADFRAKAEEQYKKAVAADPDHYIGYIQLAQLYAEPPESNFDAAFKVLKERMERGLKRDHYLGWRNQQYMNMLRAAAFQVNISKWASLVSDGKTKEANKEEFQPILDSLNEIYRQVVAELIGGADDPNALTMRGRLMMIQENYYEAIKDFKRAQELSRGANPELQFQLGQLYIQTNSPGLAEEALRQAVNALPNAVEPRALLASVLNQSLDANGRPRAAEAQQEAERVLQIDPENRTATAALARAYEIQGMYDRMQPLLAKLSGGQGNVQDKLSRASLLQLQATSTDVVDTAKLAEAEQLLREVVAADPANIAALQRLLQQLSSTPDNSDKIIEVLNASRGKLEQMRSDAAASQPAGDRVKELAAAIEAVERFKIIADPKITPEDKIKGHEEIIRRGSDPYLMALNLCSLYMQANRPADAYKALQDAYKQKPSEPQVVSTLFRLALDQKQWKFAEELADKAVALNLDPSGGRFYRARLLMAQTEVAGHMEQAIKEIRQGIAAVPSHVEGYTLLGQALAQSKQYEEAQRAFEQAIKLNPQSPIAAVGLAVLASERGDQSERQRYLGLCAQVAPNHPWVQSQLRDLQDERDPKSGIARREEFRKTNPTDLQNLWKLAQLYAITREFDKAKGLFEEVRKQAPQDLMVAKSYAEFLVGKEPPEPKPAEEMLRKLVEDIDAKESEKKAAAQLLVCNYLRNRAERRAPDAVTLEQLNAEYAKAAELANTAPVLLDIGQYFLTTGQPDEAEGWFRKALERSEQTEYKQQAFRLLVQSLLSDNDPRTATRAQQEIARYREAYPDDNLALIFQAEYETVLGRDNEAIAAYTTYIQKEPDKPLGYLSRGLVYYRQSDWELAARDFREVKRLNPKALQARILLANALENTQQYDTAISELQSILQENPESELGLTQLVSLYIKLKRYDSAESLITTISKQQPDRATWDGFRVQIAKARNDKDAAIRYATSGVEKSGYALAAVNVLLELYLDYGRYDELLNFVSTKLKPEKQSHGIVKIRLGAATLMKKDVAKALDLFHQAFADSGPMLPGFFDLFRIGILPQKEAVLAAVRQRSQAEPQDRNWKYMLALAESANGKYAEAVKVLQELLASISPDSKLPQEKNLLLQQVGVQYYNQKQFAEARKVYEQILETDPSNVEALNNLAYMLLEHFQDPKAALPYSRRAVLLVPDHAKAHKVGVLDTLGWNFVQVGMHSQAISTLQKAIELNSQSPTVHYHLAECFFSRAQVEGSTTKDSDTKRAVSEAQQAYELIRSAGSDPEEILPKLAELGTKLGLKLDKNITSRPAS